MDARKIRRIACFVLAHNVQRGEPEAREPDWCARCGYDADEIIIRFDEAVTLPFLLWRTYHWLADRDWPWFERLDIWLWNHTKRHPRWWKW